MGPLSIVELVPILIVQLCRVPPSSHIRGSFLRNLLLPSSLPMFFKKIPIHKSLGKNLPPLHTGKNEANEKKLEPQKRGNDENIPIGVRNSGYHDAPKY